MTCEKCGAYMIVSVDWPRKWRCPYCDVEGKIGTLEVLKELVNHAKAEVFDGIIGFGVKDKVTNVQTNT